MLGKLTRRIHPSWLIAWFSTGVLGGITLAYATHRFVNVSFAWAILAIAVLSATCLYRRRWIICLALLAGVVFGIWRASISLQTTAAYQPYIGRSVVMFGTVAADITHKNGELGITLGRIRIGQNNLGGTIWAGSNSDASLQRGDQVALIGKMSNGFGPFAASMSYAHILQVTHPTAINLPLRIRDTFNAGIRRAVPEPLADLGIGYLTGQHNELSPTLVQQLQLVGLIHLVIAGGYNVTILVRFARRLFGKISKYLALLSAGTLLLGLTLMAGFSAPMARTAIVTGLSLAAWYYGRRLHPLVLLPLSAAVTALINPTFVWGDVGWYLTFVAYGGLIILAPMFKQWLWPGKPVGTLRQICVDTLSVQIVTMPLLAFAFQQYSIYGLPANLLVLPLMPLTMLAAAAAGVAGMVLPAAAAAWIGWPTRILLGYTARVTGVLSTAPGADFSAAFSAALLAAAYAVILVFIYLLWRKMHYDFRAENIVE